MGEDFYNILMVEDLCVAETGKYGKGVFAGRNYRAGEKILKFQGPLLHYDDIVPGSLEDNMTIQVAKNYYIGPSGGIDDYINHSCDPSSGLKLFGGELQLVAIRDIGAGEEITFDYSTSMNESFSEMGCVCGSSKCRGLIRDFQLLPQTLRHEYTTLGIVPSYIFE